MEQFGRYVLLERIAQGGMAEVFRAAAVGSAGFSKVVAIKRILPHLAAEQSFVTMLVDEAKIASTLIHPNILQVLDLGDHRGVYFIAMEFVVGRSLDGIISRAIRSRIRLPQEFCVHVVREALQGLAYAHQKTDSFGQPAGIIHRDISPQNIMVGYDGSVKLADFGIARAAERTTHTVTGTIKGKPGYMSPEQVLGKEIDQRLDIYAMGVVLHEMLCMKRMRKAQSDAQVLLAVANGEFPRFEQQGVDVPELLADIVYQALAPEPKDRTSDSATFAHQLEDVGRALGWHYGSNQVAKLMAELFPEEIEKERQAQLHFAQVLKDPPVEEISIVLEPDTVVKGLREPPAGAPVPLRRTTSGGMPAVEDSQVFAKTTVTPMGLSSVQPGAIPPQGPMSMGTPPPMIMHSGMHPAMMAPPPQRSAFVPALLGGLVVLLAAGGGIWWNANRMAAATAAPAATASLIIESEPRGATVRLNGKLLDGVTPLAMKDVAAGPVEVEVALEGMEPVKEVAVLQPADTRTLKITLRPASAQVAVTSEPTGARLTLGGADVGKTPVTITINSKDAQTLVASLPGYEKQERALSTADAPETLHLTLTAAPQPVRAPEPTRARPEPRRARPAREKPEPEEVRPAGMGKINIFARPWGRVKIDGRDIGKNTPVMEYAVPAGRHVINIHNPEENVSATLTVDVKPNELTPVRADLK